LQRRHEELLLSYLNVEGYGSSSPPTLSNIAPRFLSKLAREVPQEPLLALTTLNKTYSSKPARKLSAKKVLISEQEKTRLSNVFPKHL